MESDLWRRRKVYIYCLENNGLGLSFGQRLEGSSADLGRREMTRSLEGQRFGCARSSQMARHSSRSSRIDNTRGRMRVEEPVGELGMGGT